jgi:hypothetical protein
VSLYLGGRWCRECGAEYRPEFTECADCRVPLVNAKPPTPVEAEADHEIVEYDLGDWDDSQRGALRLLLHGREIPHTWDSTSLAVPTVREQEVDRLIDMIDAAPTPDADDVPVDVRERTDASHHRGPAIASPSRRLLGFVVDAVLLAPLTISLARGGFQRPHEVTVRGQLAALTVVACYEIVSVALWGRTLGKLVAGTKIVSAETLTTPGWRAAIVRWAVTAAVDAGSIAAGSLSGLKGQRDRHDPASRAPILLVLRRSGGLVGGKCRCTRRMPLHTALTRSPSSSSLGVWTPFGAANSDCVGGCRRRATPPGSRNA